MNGNGKRTDGLDRAVDLVRQDAPDSEAIEAATRRVWARLSAGGTPSLEQDLSEPDRIRGCADVQALIPAWLDARLPEARATLVADHTRNCVPCRRALLEARAVRSAAGRTAAAVPARPRLRAASWLRAAAAVVLVGGVSAAAWVAWRQTAPPVLAANGWIQQLEGLLFRLEDGAVVQLASNDQIERGQVVRTGRNGGAVVRLSDGSRIEMRERSEIALDRKGDGAVIELARGSLVVEASPQGAGHLYVSTGDCLVAVTGTIFSVDHGALGSRVGVIEGEVHVTQPGKTSVLAPGDQVATRSGIAPIPLSEQVAWSRNVAKYAQMLASLSDLGREIDARVSMPGMRTSTKLLDLAPRGTVVYVAFPNLSSQIGEASRVIQERMAADEALRGWWERSMEGDEFKAELTRLIDRVETLGADLGEEIVLTVQASGGQPDGFTLLAELRDAEGFRSALQAELERAAGAQEGPRHWRFLEPGQRAGDDGDGEVLLVWAHDGLLVAGNAGSTVDEVLAAVTAKSAPLAGSAFRDRIAGAYADGADWLFAVDATRLLPESGESKIEQLGVLDVEHLVVEHERRGERTLDTATLTFDRPRRGLASWLAEPAPMGGLGFVSPDATMAAAFVVREPAALADEFLGMIGGTDASLAEGAARFQREHGIDLRKDLAEPLGGEFVFALDGPMLPKPAWKLVVEVYDPVRLQSTLERLATEADRAAQEADRGRVTLETQTSGGRTYHVIHTPVMDLHYTFEDGYLLAAPMRVLLDQAIERRASGIDLPSSSRFASMLPQGTGTHVSALAWENLGPALQAAQSAAGAAGQGGNASLQRLAKDWPGTLVYAVAGRDRITFSSGGKAGLEDDLTRLFGLPGLLASQAAVERELTEGSGEPEAPPVR